MRAVLCTQFGGADMLTMADLAAPKAGPGEVVVAVAAAALNFFDTLLIEGRYQVRPPFPFSPAGELAGVVCEVGPGVTTLQRGDRVAGFIGHGAAREQVVAPAERLVRIPAELDFMRAAGLSVTYGTTLHALRNRARLQAGETLVVLGASGGAGLAAVEIGRQLGARVIACASSEEKLAFARKHGAEVGINYETVDLKEAVMRATEGRGADVVYDPVGGRHAVAALRSLAWRGRHLVIGFAAGTIPQLPLNHVLLKEREVLGVYWGGWAEQDPQGYRADLEQIFAWCAAGTLSGHVDAVYPLEEAAAALHAIGARKVRGKVVLQVSAEI